MGSALKSWEWNRVKGPFLPLHVLFPPSSPQFGKRRMHEHNKEESADHVEIENKGRRLRGRWQREDDGGQQSRRGSREQTEGI